MFDLKALRDDPAAFDAAWARRGLAAQTPAILAADRALRDAQGAFQAAQARRNEASKLIGAAKKAGDEARAAELMAEVEGLKAVLSGLPEQEKAAEAKLRDILAALPNLPADDVPDGVDEHGNVEVEDHRFGDPKALPAGRLHAPKDHVALGEALGMMDFEAAARMSGARFVVLKKDLARLERALGQFMLDMQTREHGYEEVSPPLLVRDNAMYGTGQLPKFGEDLFYATSVRKSGSRDVNLFRREGYKDRAVSLNPGVAKSNLVIGALTILDVIDKALDTALYPDPGLRQLSAIRNVLAHSSMTDETLWMLPTAEVSLTNLIREQITPEEQLPLRYTALTPCFRSEAGASGRDTRGMIRQHQFTKCELVSITTPEQSEAEHERMVECAEAVLKRLELPFRTMLLCAGDMGFAAKKTYDLEVWLPSQATYREISSCSNCGDFQARRMDARIKAPGEKGTRFPHTLNGSGLAVGRTLVAVMENYQDEAGRIAIPAALQGYMGGMTHIGGAA
jgi:seryl-tRNA synthetase